MSIRVTCGGCQKTYKVKDRFAGKRGACPFCRAPIDVPRLPADRDVKDVRRSVPTESPGGGSPSTTMSLMTHVPMAPCPHCGKNNLAGSPKCYHCKQSLPAPSSGSNAH